MSISSRMKNMHNEELKFKFILIPRTPDEIRKATKTPEEQMRDRIQSYWNSLSSGIKKDFLRIKISDLKAHFSPLNDGSPCDVLDEALSFGEANEVWKVLTCFPCKERFADTHSFTFHVYNEHIREFLPMVVSALPQIVENEWAEMLLTCSWKPLELNDTMRILKENSKPKAPDFNDSCEKKSLLQEELPLSDDNERATLLENIRAVFHALIKRKCLASSHLNQVIQFAVLVLQGLEGGPLLISSKMDQTPLCIRLLGASELDKILKYLEEISKACGMSTCPNESDVTDVSEDGEQRDDIIERVNFSEDCSFLVLDEHFLPCKTPFSSCNEAVCCDSSSATSSHITDYNDGVLDSDALLSWLFTGPSSEEQLAAWASVREDKNQQGLQTLQLIENKICSLKPFLETKYDHLCYEEVLRAVEGLCSRREKKREDTADFSIQSYESVLKDREEVLKESSIIGYLRIRSELAAIRNVLNDAQNVSQSGLKETQCDLISHLCALESVEVDNGKPNDYLKQVDSHIEVAIQRQKEKVCTKLCHDDAMLMRILKEIQDLVDMLKTASSHDYRSILIPLVKSFLRARLEDLVEKDATEKFDAAKKALITELALNSKKSVNAGVDHSKYVNGKNKDLKIFSWISAFCSCFRKWNFIKSSRDESFGDLNDRYWSKNIEAASSRG